MRRCLRLIVLFPALLSPQTTPESIAKPLRGKILSPDVTEYQIRHFVTSRVPKLVPPVSAKQWSAESARLRKRFLEEVAFYGWPREWVEAKPRFEDLGTIPSGKGYRLRKLRYEIVPGFWSSALLYEPENLNAKVPAILNVNGHESEGKSTEYIQKRCIAQARQGILSLNLEWIGMGELAQPENLHWYGAHLDLVGANSLGVFYLAMRHGLDYLWDHPSTDRARIGITGLSGGGWQSIVLAALDERILAAVPNAGYFSGLSLAAGERIGDNEQSATDFHAFLDYTHLTAMRAPRPTLLIYNEVDDCCFRAPRIKPILYGPIKPFFAIYDVAEKFAWHDNIDPGTHNYQLDNRMQSYRFFAKAFGLPEPKDEAPSAGDIKSREELNVGLPAGNHTLFTLARAMSERMGAKLPADKVIRYKPVAVREAVAMDNSYAGGVQSVSFRLEFDNGLNASAVRFRTSDSTPWTIFIDDKGKAESRAAVSERLNRGEQTLSLDPLMFGDAAWPEAYPITDRMMSTVGERLLGIEVAQVIAAARWASASPVRLEASGIRASLVAQIAGRVSPGQFREVRTSGGLSSLGEIFTRKITYQSAPELFCLDLMRGMW